MTHLLCLISEISCGRVSLLVVCILLSSEDRFETVLRLQLRLNTLNERIDEDYRLPGSQARSEGEDENCSGGTNRALKSAFCVFSDDRTEEAEAAHRLARTPSAHEHQPSAARVRPSCNGGAEVMERTLRRRVQQ